MTVYWLGSEPCHDPTVVGGKAANLSRLASNFRVPPGFAVPDLPATSSALSGETEQAIRDAYGALGEQVGEASPYVAVRSSALDEDTAAASFAGQHSTFLNVRGEDEVLAAVLRCAASAAAPQALQYRASQGVSADDIRMAVLVQLLVDAEVAAVAFSANPVTGSRDEVVINSNWGLGESIVSGTATPDTYIVDKRGWSLLARDLGAKELMTVRAESGTRDVETPEAMREHLSLTDAQAVELAAMASALETQLGAPVDIECAFAGGQLYLLQCRPITTLG